MGNTHDKVLALLSIIVLLWVAVCISLHPFVQPDIFWQLRVGHDIVATGRPPHYETYSWDRHGTRWSVSEWLTFVGYYEAYLRLGGFAGLLDLRLAFNIIAVFTQFIFLRKLTGSTVVSFLLASASETAGANFFQTRPYQITSICSIIVAYLVVAVRSGTLKPKSLLWLMPLAALWANLHQGFILAIAILSIYAGTDAGIGAFLTAIGRAKPQAASNAAMACWFAIAALATVIGSLLSPYGFEPYSMVFRTMLSPISRFIIEWMPLPMAWSLETAALAVIAAAVGAALLLAKDRDIGTVVVTIILAVEALQHQRNVPLFALLAPILVAPEIKHVINRARNMPKVNRHRIQRLCHATAISVATWNLVLWTSTAQCVVATVETRSHATGRFWNDLGNSTANRYAMPESTAEYIRANDFPSNLRLFNDLGSGGYFIWKLPQMRVFIDGRNDPYFGGVLEDYHSAISAHSASDFQRIMAHYNFDGVITCDPFIRRCYASEPNWVQVYPLNGDDQTWIYLRRSPRTAALIARCLSRNPPSPPALSRTRSFLTRERKARNAIKAQPAGAHS